MNHHLDVPFRTLDKKYAFGDADSGNMIIHGDNLEALKALLPRYEGRIKCIYIDPPYNTGASPQNGGWCYYDNVDSPRIRKWLGQVVGKEEEDLTRHDKWLCMMYPRLVLLQKLLADDGAVFISIDDNEQANLKLICDEIFGIQNYVGELIWKSKSGGANDSRFFAVDQEYIFVYAKNAEKFVLLKDKNAEVTTCYNFEDENGRYALDRLDKQSIRYSDSLNYEIIGPDGTSYYPKHKNPNKPNATWRWGKETVKERYSELVFKNGCVYTKNYKKNESTPRSLLVEDRFGRTRTGKTELFSCFGVNIFSNPKPSKLICHLIELCSDKESIILDSFAGSGTTAHAVLNLNKQDGGNRKFILVEMEDYAENITAERVRRVIKGYNYDTDEETVVYSKELKASNMKKWPTFIGEAENEAENVKNEYDKVVKKIEDNTLKVIGINKAKGEIIGTGGGFAFYELGDRLFNDNGNLNENIGTEKIREYIWYSETREPIRKEKTEITNDGERVPIDNSSCQISNYLLGLHNGTAYYFYYEPNRTTTLDRAFLNTIGQKAEQYVIYADNCLLSDEFMRANNIIFKKIPRDINKL